MVIVVYNWNKRYHRRDNLSDPSDLHANLSHKCYSAPPVPTFCWQSSHWMTSASSAAHALMSIESRASSRIRCTLREKRSMMCLEAQMPSRMLTQQQSNVPTLTTAAINEPTSSRSRFAQATNLQRFSISVQNVVISGKKIDICHKSLSNAKLIY